MTLDYLLLAGVLNFGTAALHIAVIIGGSSWYRLFGAGEEMARMAEQKSLIPTLVTAGIAVILASWGLYAFSGAGLIPPLPLLKLVLIFVTVIYLLRAIAGLIAPWFVNATFVQQNSHSFWVWSSLICLFIGLCHLKGLSDVWLFL
jgi:putative oxidoreductase